MSESTNLGESDIRAMPYLVAFGTIAVLMAHDLLGDWMAGSTGLHIGLEAVVMLVAGLSAARLGQTLLRRRSAMREELEEARRLAERATSEQEASAAEAARWRAEAQSAMRGLSEAIDRQLERWGLTPAEAEVALLLLKGLSTKDIAELRDTTDATVRQQARSIYGKSGLGGRAQLAAFFLEDLMLPARDEAS